MKPELITSKGQRPNIVETWTLQSVQSMMGATIYKKKES